MSEVVNSLEVFYKSRIDRARSERRRGPFHMSYVNVALAEGLAERTSVEKKLEQMKTDGVLPDGKYENLMRQIDRSSVDYAFALLKETGHELKITEKGRELLEKRVKAA